MEDVYKSIAAAWPLAPGTFRVVVSAGAGKLSTHDFDDSKKAKTYADDVAAEAGDVQALAFVYDASFVRVHEGRAYFMKQLREELAVAAFALPLNVLVAVEKKATSETKASAKPAEKVPHADHKKTAESDKHMGHGGDMSGHGSDC